MKNDPKRFYRYRAWREIKSEGPIAYLAPVLLFGMAITHITEHGWAALHSVQAAIYVAILVLLLIYWRLFTISLQVHQFQDTIDVILTDPDCREDGPVLSDAAITRFRHWLQLDA